MSGVRAVACLSSGLQTEFLVLAELDNLICRDIVQVSSPAYTQSCLLLKDSTGGLAVRHDRFPPAAMNFRALSATLLLQGYLSAISTSDVSAALYPSLESCQRPWLITNWVLLACLILRA